ncbi:formin-like protein 20 [Dorcoceras hygrometricum]|uniref:Formin-like protein 20 n=1 Tax=Dorcoceras hygrometricum TaxID=472368 RepID=A0A2Z7C301_9LAMI|nr:formin-like protein 20 [Dorcoceras hygrometricum]
MSLFDLQDVCIAIGSLETLDLPMVVDLIGIYVMKVPYCTLTTTNWFLQALSVIPRGSWGDVARRFTMIRWATPNSAAHSSPSLTHAAGRRLAPPCAAAVRRPLRDRTCFDHHDEVFLIVPKSISFLVQADWRKIESGRGPD